MTFISSVFGTIAALALLAWLPSVGPFAAGVIGGWLSRSPAVAAAMLFTVSVAIAGIIAGATGILTGITGVGVALGAASWLIVLLHFGPLVIGTIVGLIARMALDLRQKRRS